MSSPSRRLISSLSMLLGSGPTLLAVGLAAQLHGTRWVAGSALAFAAGSLLAPFLVARLERRTLPPAIAWPALGVGMVGGWAFAALSPLALLAAQLLSGMCMSALEGDMDARVATKATTPGRATAGLATAAALRAFGSAAAVAMAPRVVAEAGIGWLAGALGIGLATLAVLRLAWWLRHRTEAGRRALASPLGAGRGRRAGQGDREDGPGDPGELEGGLGPGDGRPPGGRGHVPLDQALEPEPGGGDPGPHGQPTGRGRGGPDPPPVLPDQPGRPRQQERPHHPANPHPGQQQPEPGGANPLPPQLERQQE